MARSTINAAFLDKEHLQYGRSSVGDCEDLVRVATTIMHDQCPPVVNTLPDKQQVLYDLYQSCAC